MATITTHDSTAITRTHFDEDRLHRRAVESLCDSRRDGCRTDYVPGIDPSRWADDALKAHDALYSLFGGASRLEIDLSRIGDLLSDDDINAIASLALHGTAFRLADELYALLVSRPSSIECRRQQKHDLALSPSSAQNLAIYARLRENIRFAELSEGYTPEAIRKCGELASELFPHDEALTRTHIQNLDWLWSGMVGRMKIGRKVSRMNLPQDVKFAAEDVARFARTVDAIRALFRKGSPRYRVAISGEPHRMLDLGDMRCDAGSCYNAGHEFGGAPVVLAQSPNSVVLLLKEYDPERVQTYHSSSGLPYESDNNPVVARAWGFVEEDTAAFSNVYARTLRGDKPTAIAAFLGALKAVHQDLDLTAPRFDFRARAQYTNGDAIVLRTAADARFSGYIAPINDDGVDMDAGSVIAHCEDCGAAIHADDVHCLEIEAGVHVCEACGESYVYSEIEDRHIPDDEAVEYWEYTRLGSMRSVIDYAPSSAPYIIETYNGDYWLERDTLELADGRRAPQFDEDVIQLTDGEHALMEDAVFDEELGEYRLAS